MSFKSIKFGLAAAEKERSDNPRLLTEGFFDEYGYINDLQYGSKFLILGSKGSGKSAIASKLELLSKNPSNKLCILLDDLESFPFSAFSGIFRGGESPEIRFPNHWEFILLIALCNSLAKDKTCISRNDIKLEKMFNVLRELGMLPSKTLTEIVKITTKKEFKLGVPKVLETTYSSEKESKYDIDLLWGTLKDVCYSVNSDNKHLIIIDGLDDVLTKSEKQYSALSSLILAADRMNKKLSSNKINAKVIVLCRIDLFDRLEGPNNNKIRHDSGIILDWYQDTRDVHSTNLVKLTNLRAKLSCGKEVDIFRTYLPPRIINQDTTAKILLDHTRHTPRDFIKLLSYIQQHTKGDKPTADDILNGIRSYSIEYFVPEIKDELVGYVDREDKENIFRIFIGLNKHRFKVSELDFIIRNDKDDHVRTMNTNNILEALFNCSAIGNVKDGNFAGGQRYTMKFRNRYAKFNPNEEIIIHRGLQKGLNITG